MFNRIRQYFHSRRRLIFRFNDGSRIRGVDPIETSVALHNHESYLPRHLKEAASGEREAQRIVAQTACDVFGVSRFDGYKTGMTVAERIELMFAFDTYIEVLKKNIGLSPMLPTSTESTSQTSSDPTTNDTLGSTSTATDLSLEKPTSLPQ
jgi:hypothetical protein